MHEFQVCKVGPDNVYQLVHEFRKDQSILLVVLNPHNF